MDDSVTYTSTLDMRRTTVAFLAGLLEAERARRGMRTDTRALTRFHQAVLIVRWFLDAARVSRLATDHRIRVSTAYRYLHEGINALAAQAPDLHTALDHAKQVGISHPSPGGVAIPPTAARLPARPKASTCGGPANTASMVGISMP